VPLVEDSVNSQIKLLESKYFEFSKNIDTIKDYQIRLKTMTILDYRKQKNEM